MSAFTPRKTAIKQREGGKYGISLYKKTNTK
jgi:hypothetical protein